MLSYFLRSNTSRALFDLLWRQQASGNAHELAKAAGLDYRRSSGELRRMVEGGLATVATLQGHQVYRANTEHAQASLLSRLARVPESPPAPQNAEVRQRLRDVGAPLAVEGTAPGAKKPLEEVLVESVRASRDDAAVSRALPVAFWKNRKNLDGKRLVALAKSGRDKHALGFFLELTDILSGQPDFRFLLPALEDKRLRGARPFFVREEKSRHLRLLSEVNAPDLARRWNFTMNMTLENFRGYFLKHVSP